MSVPSGIGVRLKPSGICYESHDSLFWKCDLILIEEKIHRPYNYLYLIDIHYFEIFSIFHNQIGCDLGDIIKNKCRLDCPLK